MLALLALTEPTERRLSAVSEFRVKSTITRSPPVATFATETRKRRPPLGRAIWRTRKR